MKTKLIFTLALLTVTASLSAGEAGETKRRTIVVQDGKLLGDFDELRGKRAFLGVSLIDLTPELREYFGGSKDSGVIVGSIENGSPAEKAGLKIGDVVVSVDGKDVDSSWDLRRALSDKKEGDTVRIDYMRGKQRASTMATLVERQGLIIQGADWEEMGRKLSETFGDGSHWQARMLVPQNCDELQAKIKELEARMKDLEKKLK
jgi:membrane-associated protease RseP (regulator of RpoE activity)